MAKRSKRPDLSAVEKTFIEAVAFMRRGDLDLARQAFKEVLRTEPRLPEPYLELAVIDHGAGDLDLAIEEARMGLDLLEKGGQWIDSLPDHVVIAHAQNLLGELLVELSQKGETPFVPERFAPLWNEAVALFEDAHRTDPQNDRARANALLHEQVPDPTSPTGD